MSGGERCRFRAIGIAELQSATADTDPFELPRAPRRVFIDAPPDTCGIPAGPVALAALVDTRGLGPIAPQEIRWASSLDGDLGSGYSLTAYLNEGRHEVSVTAPDGVGGMLAERAIIVVGGKPKKSA